MHPAGRDRRFDIPPRARHSLPPASEELRSEPKRLLPEVLQRFKHFAWPGNVRQLENICRWLTVMAPGQDVHLQDLPPELQVDAPVRPEPVPAATVTPTPTASAPPQPAASPVAAIAPAAMPVVPVDVPNAQWHEQLRKWAAIELAAGHSAILDVAVPLFERTMIETALAATHGQRQDAAKRLGWGRNTLTRKIKELGLDD